MQLTACESLDLRHIMPVVAAEACAILGRAGGVGTPVISSLYLSSKTPDWAI